MRPTKFTYLRDERGNLYRVLVPLAIEERGSKRVARVQLDHYADVAEVELEDREGPVLLELAKPDHSGDRRSNHEHAALYHVDRMESLGMLRGIDAWIDALGTTIDSDSHKRAGTTRWLKKRLDAIRSSPVWALAMQTDNGDRAQTVELLVACAVDGLLDTTEAEQFAEHPEGPYEPYRDAIQRTLQRAQKPADRELLAVALNAVAALWSNQRPVDG